MTPGTPALPDPAGDGPAVRRFGWRRLLRFLLFLPVFLLPWLLAAIVGDSTSIAVLDFDRAPRADGTQVIWLGWPRLLALMVLAALPLLLTLISNRRGTQPAAWYFLGVGTLGLIAGTMAALVTPAIEIGPAHILVRDTALWGGGQRELVRFDEVTSLERRSARVRQPHLLGSATVTRHSWWIKPKDAPERALNLKDVPEPMVALVVDALRRRGTAVR